MGVRGGLMFTGYFRNAVASSLQTGTKPVHDEVCSERSTHSFQDTVG